MIRDDSPVVARLGSDGAERKALSKRWRLVLRRVDLLVDVLPARQYKTGSGFEYSAHWGHYNGQLAGLGMIPSTPK